MNAPDPVPPPVKMSEAKARKVLLTIAALEGGSVQKLMDISSSVGFVGYAHYPEQPPMFPTSRELWTWADRDSSLAWRSLDTLGHRVLAVGRIDRGLGS